VALGNRGKEYVTETGCYTTRTRVGVVGSRVASYRVVSIRDKVRGSDPGRHVCSRWREVIIASVALPSISLTGSKADFPDFDLFNINPMRFNRSNRGQSAALW